MINTSSYDKLQIYVHTKKFMFSLFKRRYVPLCWTVNVTLINWVFFWQIVVMCNGAPPPLTFSRNCKSKHHYYLKLGGLPSPDSLLINHKLSFDSLLINHELSKSMQWTKSKIYESKILQFTNVCSNL